MTPADEGKAVVLRLPSKIDRFPTEKENFAWYKVILTHQAGHVEFGTFEFQFARASRHFDDWRPRLAHPQTRGSATSELDRFVQLFPDRQLGTVIFEQIEDARIDARLLVWYPGMEPLYRRVTRGSALEPARGFFRCRCVKRFWKDLCKQAWAENP